MTDMDPHPSLFIPLRDQSITPPSSPQISLNILNLIGIKIQAIVALTPVSPAITTTAVTPHPLFANSARNLAMLSAIVALFYINSINTLLQWLITLACIQATHIRTGLLTRLQVTMLLLISQTYPYMILIRAMTTFSLVMALPFLSPTQVRAPFLMPTQNFPFLMFCVFSPFKRI